MAKRTETLYPPATQIANQLVSEMGNQKLVLSAGVVSLSKLEAGDRQIACREARGAGNERLCPYSERDALLRLKDEIRDLLTFAKYNPPGEDQTIVLPKLLKIIEHGLTARVAKISSSAKSVAEGPLSHPQAPDNTKLERGKEG